MLQTLKLNIENSCAHLLYLTQIIENKKMQADAGWCLSALPQLNYFDSLCSETQ